MSTRRFSVALPTPVAEHLAAMAVHSGVRPSEILAEALGQFEPFREFAKRGSSDEDDPNTLWKFFEELERHPDDDDTEK